MDRSAPVHPQRAHRLPHHATILRVTGWLAPAAAAWTRAPTLWIETRTVKRAAFTSAAANNGSGFEGLGDNTPFWNIATGLVMLLGRYIPIIAPLALAGALDEDRALDRLAALVEDGFGED